MLTFAPEWEYDGQGGMATVKDYQRIPTPGWTAIQQVKYIETLRSVALEDGIHLRTLSMHNEIHVAPINCSPEDDAWDITYTFLKADRLTGLKADISNLEPVHVAKTSTDPADAGFKRAVADRDLARSSRIWAHTFIPKAAAIASGLAASSGEAESDWVKPAARFANFQATSAAAAAKGTEESKGEERKFKQLLAADGDAGCPDGTRSVPDAQDTGANASVAVAHDANAGDDFCWPGTAAPDQRLDHRIHYGYLCEFWLRH